MTEYERMIQFLDMGWHMREEIVPCLVGPPGIGKTAAVMQHAKAHGCGKVVKIVASRCVPSETVGMTMPDNERRTMEIYNSMQLSSLNDKDILFLDELLEADQFVLSTLLTVIESREMADGTPLPDIQIVSATNDTIPPEQLKGNIRQRFMFMRFNVDRAQVYDYIVQRTGMRMPDDVLRQLCSNGNDYNFLTPRSLTKLCMWMDSVDADEIDTLTRVINDIWKSSIGTSIAMARRKRDQKIASPEAQLRKEIEAMAYANIVPMSVTESEHFDDCTMAELLETLQSLPNWVDIKELLSATRIEESKEEEGDIVF
jgi:hypothetical protein